MTCVSIDPAARRALALSRIAVAANFFAAGAALGVWAAHVPLLKAGAGLDDGALGFVLLAMGAGALVSMPATGALTHRFGAVGVMVCAGLLFVAALAVPPLATGFWELAGAAFLLGLLLGGLDVAMNAHAGALERAWGRPIMSSIHAFFSLGALAGAAAAGGLIALDIGVDLAMTLSALTLGGLVGVASLWLGPSLETGGGGPGLKLPSPTVAGLGLLGLLAFMAEGAMIDWSAVYMTQAAGASPALAAGAYAAFSAAMTFGRLTGDRVVGRLGPVRAVQLSGAVAGLGLAAVVVAPHSWAAIAGFGVTGLGLANIVPVLFSAAGRAPGVAPASALAMVATLSYGGGLMGPPLIGFAAEAIGLRAAFLLLVAAAFAVALGVGRAITPPGRPRGG